MTAVRDARLLDKILSEFRGLTPREAQLKMSSSERLLNYFRSHFYDPERISSDDGAAVENLSLEQELSRKLLPLMRESAPQIVPRLNWADRQVGRGQNYSYQGTPERDWHIVHQLSITTDGTRAITFDAGQNTNSARINIWDTVNNQLMHQFTVPFAADTNGWISSLYAAKTDIVLERAPSMQTRIKKLSYVFKWDIDWKQGYPNFQGHFPAQDWGQRQNAVGMAPSESFLSLCDQTTVKFFDKKVPHPKNVPLGTPCEDPNLCISTTAWMPDSDLLAAVYYDGESSILSLINPELGVVVKSGVFRMDLLRDCQIKLKENWGWFPPYNQDKLSRLQFSDDGQTLLASNHLIAVLWDVESWTIRSVFFSTMVSAATLASALNSDGTMLAVSYKGHHQSSEHANRAISIYDTRTGKKLEDVTGEFNDVLSLAFRMGDQVLFAGTSNGLWTWRVGNREKEEGAPVRNLGALCDLPFDEISVEEIDRLEGISNKWVTPAERFWAIFIAALVRYYRRHDVMLDDMDVEHSPESIDIFID